MGKVRLVYSAVFALLILISLNAGSSDSKITGPSYENLVKAMDYLAMNHPFNASTVRYGKSVEGRDLVLVKIEKFGVESKNAPAMVITEATHGYEYLHVADQLPQFLIKSISKEKYLKKFVEMGGAVYVVPIFNPDGYEARQRVNANGVDLNRNFDDHTDRFDVFHPAFSQPETRYFRDYLAREMNKTGRKLGMVLNYHCCGRFSETLEDIAQFGYPYAGSYEALPYERRIQYFKFGEHVQKIFNHDRIQAGQWSFILYKRDGVSVDYFEKEYKAFSFIYEGLEAEEFKRIESHKKLMLFFIKYLVRHPPGDS